jgi:hypothetical protein
LILRESTFRVIGAMGRAIHRFRLGGVFLEIVQSLSLHLFNHDQNIAERESEGKIGADSGPSDLLNSFNDCPEEDGVYGPTNSTGL